MVDFRDGESSSEWIQRLLSDPDMQRQARERVAAGQREAALNRPILDEILADLAGVGYVVESLPDLPVLCDGDPAVPVLVGWLSKAPNDSVKAGVVRALTFKSADEDLASLLIDEFEAASPSSVLGWDLGNALGAMANPTLLDELLRLAQDEKYGRSRSQIVSALGRFRDDERVLEAVIGLVSDPSVVIEAVGALRKLRTPAAIPTLRSVVDHDDEIVREEAVRGLEELGAL